MKLFHAMITETNHAPQAPDPACLHAICESGEQNSLTGAPPNTMPEANELGRGRQGVTWTKHNIAIDQAIQHNFITTPLNGGLFSKMLKQDSDDG